MKKLIAITVLLFFAAGCTPARFHQTGNRYTPYRGRVRVFTGKPKLRYEEVGRVYSFGKYSQRLADFITAVQKNAAANGANAVILKSYGTATYKSRRYYTGYGIRHNAAVGKRLDAVAIRTRK